MQNILLHHSLKLLAITSLLLSTFFFKLRKQSTIMLKIKSLIFNTWVLLWNLNQNSSLKSMHIFPMCEQSSPPFLMMKFYSLDLNQALFKLKSRIPSQWIETDWNQDESRKKYRQIHAPDWLSQVVNQITQHHDIIPHHTSEMLKIPLSLLWHS